MQTTTRNNQTLLDIAVQECGTVEAAFEIAERNGLALTDELNTGQKLDIVMTTTREESVVQELAADRIKPATAPSARGDGNGSLRRYRVYGDRNRLCGTMRTIEEIKETICADFMRNESVAGVVRIYAGRQLHVAFQQGIRHRDSVLHFSPLRRGRWRSSSTRTRARWTHASRRSSPHRPRWYRDKVLAFMKGKTLIADTDRYDTEGMTEDAIAAARVVKHAVAVENRDASLLTIKVAGEKDGKRCRARRRDRGAACGLHRRDQGRGRTHGAGEHRPRPLQTARRTCTTTRLLVAETVESACREAVPQLHREPALQWRIYQHGARRCAPDARRRADRGVPRGDDRRGRRGGAGYDRRAVHPGRGLFRDGRRRTQYEGIQWISTT